MDGPGRYLQWAGECLPLPERQSRWPGLLEELLKVFVGHKRDNELLPGSPGLFPNAIPWLCKLQPKATEGILEEVENAVAPSVEFLGNGKQQKQQEQSWKQAPAGLTSQPGYPSPSSPAGRAGARPAMENFWESPGEERRLQLHRSVS
ncbi:uncharacterized protein LOC116438002 isoform X2 [Corvus moneduloides]|uniref:uncharacterized protein LOC116438002 isoform X2 n=1 Tax=Corvus moneduloides TaxID=1196302 RepID=UPI0013642F87|nr:uncharacterized protein LOC116438002 isoform X2 [Corvus moneduloides]